MYQLKLARDVPFLKPEVVKTGSPIYDHTIPNTVIVSQNNNSSISLNAIILRDALLNSKEFCKNVLGIEVIDSLKPKVKQPKKTEESKKEETPLETKEPKQKEQQAESRGADQWV